MLEAKERNARCQGQEPRTQTEVFSKNEKKKVLKKMLGDLQRKTKVIKKNFGDLSPLEENKKKSAQIFREVSGVFQQNFNGSKNSAVLERRIGQFLRT